jgi:hypothetical protein
MQHSVLLLLIEECAFACYYIDTARETNNRPGQKGGKQNGSFHIDLRRRNGRDRFNSICNLQQGELIINKIIKRRKTK